MSKELAGLDPGPCPLQELVRTYSYTSHSYPRSTNPFLKRTVLQFLTALCGLELRQSALFYLSFIHSSFLVGSVWWNLMEQVAVALLSGWPAVDLWFMSPSKGRVLCVFLFIPVDSGQA